MGVLAATGERHPWSTGRSLRGDQEGWRAGYVGANAWKRPVISVPSLPFVALSAGTVQLLVSAGGFVAFLTVLCAIILLPGLVG